MGKTQRKLTNGKLPIYLVYWQSYQLGTQQLRVAEAAYHHHKELGEHEDAEQCLDRMRRMKEHADKAYALWLKAKPLPTTRGVRR